MCVVKTTGYLAQTVHEPRSFYQTNLRPPRGGRINLSFDLRRFIQLCLDNKDVNNRSTASKLPQPVTLGLKKSFGYGDRLGLATPGHLAAHRKFNFAPIFAQQSIREMDRTQRTPEDVMQAAQEALATENFNERSEERRGGKEWR